MEDLKKLAEVLKNKIKNSKVECNDNADNRICKLSDKTIVKLAFKTLPMNKYDEIVAEAITTALDNVLGEDWDKV